MSRTALLAATAALSLLPGVALAQQPPTPTPGQPPAGQPPAGQPPRPQPPIPNKPQPYDQVITKDAKSDAGLITTHTVGDRYYFEIPMSLIGKEILWVTSLERSQSFYGFGLTEIQDRVIRFERRGDKLLLRAVSYQMRAQEPDSDVIRTLTKGNIEPILAVYDIRAYGKDESSAVIDASPVLYGEVSGIRFDQSRSFIESMKSFPQNILVKITGTRAGAGPQPGGAPDTVTVNHNILLLPEKPMMPRLADARVGWFSTTFNELGSAQNRVTEVTYIDRWRLEKKDPAAAVSEPVKPIVYYLGDEIPAQWKPYVRRGILAWNPVFEKAGFKNAIQVRDFPTKQEDPAFDPEDIRYTVVHWLPSGVENAYGPHLVDPRTGEILNGSPKIFHNILQAVQNLYFAQASPSDPRARKMPLPRGLTGDLLAYVVTHEVGHTLGFPHNMKASSSYTIAQLRDPKFTAQWGTEASVMDYGRMNYIAQPEDKVPTTGLIPKIGPYDYFAAHWGYGTIPDARTPEQEKPTLDRWAREQTNNPTLRFGNASAEDPGRQTEDLGDDSTEATRLGLRNLDRVMTWLIPAATKPGEDYTDLEALYNAVLDQRRTELGHVTRVVGGVTETVYAAGQSAKPNYVPVSRDRQKKAVALLMEATFKTPAILTNQGVLSRLGPTQGAAQVSSEQGQVINSLLSDARLARLQDQEARLGASAYTGAELVDDLTGAAFQELSGPRVRVDFYRRNLQRRLVTALIGKLGPSTPISLPAGIPPALAAQLIAPVSAETRALARASLQDLRARIVAAQPRAADRATRAHFQDLAAVIGDALNPRR